MEFVKLAISPTKRYFYKNASNIAMNILGEFLVTDVGYRHLPFKTWVLDSNSKNASGTLTALAKEDNYIILTDVYAKNNKPTALRMTQEQFLQILADWQEKVCILQPLSVIINYNDYEFIIETNNDIDTVMQDNITLFPLIPHKYPLWIKSGFIICCIIFFRCLSEFPYYFKLSKQVKKAHREFEDKNYVDAATHFTVLCKELPENKYMKRYLAQSLFKSDNFQDHVIALNILSTVQLKKNEWDELIDYMPTEYVKYFQETKVKL